MVEWVSLSMVLLKPQDFPRLLHFKSSERSGPTSGTEFRGLLRLLPFHSVKTNKTTTTALNFQPKLHSWGHRSSQHIIFLIPHQCWMDLKFSSNGTWPWLLLLSQWPFTHISCVKMLLFDFQDLVSALSVTLKRFHSQPFVPDAES